MKKLPTLVFSLLLLAAPSLFAADFEGRVAMKITANGQPSRLTFSMKSGRTRIEPENAPVAIILDSAKNQMIMLMSEQHIFMVRPLPAPAKAASATGVASEEVKLEKTGATEKILGYDCTKYVATGKDGTTELWLAEGLGSFAGMAPGGSSMGRRGRGPGGGLGSSDDDWVKALVGKDLFPLRVVTSKDGKEAFRMEATSVEKISLPESSFAPPADFQDMTAMMQGAMQGMMPPGMR